MTYKTIFKKSRGPETYNNLFVYLCCPTFTWNQKLPQAWGEEDTTVWEWSGPTKLSFAFNKDIEWKFQLSILGFGLIAFRQWGY